MHSMRGNSIGGRPGPPLRIDRFTAAISCTHGVTDLISVRKRSRRVSSFFCRALKVGKALLHGQENGIESANLSKTV
jgi:hypothetical protein